MIALSFSVRFRRTKNASESGIVIKIGDDPFFWFIAEFRGRRHGS